MRVDHVLLAGGGTGGHVFPAVAVAEELRERGCKVSWLGRVVGMERELVESHGLPYYGLPAAGVIGRDPIAKAMALARLGVSARRARRLIVDLEVQVVLGTGGYVSVPGVLGAYLGRRPSVLLEPNAVAGAANRWLSRIAAGAAVASRDTARQLHCPVTETGIPLRREFLDAPQEATSSAPLHLLILGGSQGARQINRQLPAALKILGTAADGLKVTHQVGGQWVEEVKAVYRQEGLDRLDLEIVPFIRDMAQALAVSDLVVSRAGAVTLAEICAVGRAALLVPLALAQSHQRANAERLVAAGAAVALAEDASREQMARSLGSLLADRQHLARMAAAAQALHRPGAAAAVADLVQGAIERN